VSEHKSSEVGGGCDPEFCGYESLKAVQSRGDRLNASEKDEAPPSRSIRRRAFQRVAPDTALYLGINVYQHPHTFPAVRPGYASLENLPDHLASFQTFFFTLPVAIVLTFVGLTRSLLSVDYIQAHTSSWMMLKRAKRMKRNLRYCKSFQSGTLNTLHRLCC